MEHLCRLRWLVPFTALALLAPAAWAQDLDQDWGAWFAFAGQGHLAPQDADARWRGWIDLHARFLEDSDGLEQTIVRPGIGYDLAQDSTIWLGYAWVHTDPESGDAFEEHRIWEQYTWSAPVGDSAVYLRSRLEQRFVETGDDVGWRFRQFGRLTQPLGSDPRLGLRLWDEVFLDLNDTDWGADTGFSQNRLFAGLGWSLDQARQATLELGYLNQYIPRSGADDGMNHILAATWIQSW